MKDDYDFGNRESIRLKGYDYSQRGLYFITICIKNHICLLGKIENKKMNLNDAGRMVFRWYNELEKKYPDKKCHQMVIMPNHIHFIIQNCMLKGNSIDPNPITPNPDDGHINPAKFGMHNIKYREPLGIAIGWFKSMTTSEYIINVKSSGWPPFKGNLWHRNYFEHIIRNETDNNRISDYILNNPAKWAEDKFYSR